MRQLRVTTATIFFDNALVVFVHLYLIGKVTGGECQRVEKSVPRLAVVFAQEIMRSMAVIAGSELAVRRFYPSVELFAHDVAIRAGCGIICQIGGTVGIAECE